jgi:membrane protease YdiL (CAAX protease family)
MTANRCSLLRVVRRGDRSIRDSPRCDQMAQWSRNMIRGIRGKEALSADRHLAEQHHLGSRRRLQDLAMLLAVSLTQPILGSVYYCLGGRPATDATSLELRVAGAIASELVGLTMLSYILVRQGRRWRDLGWSPKAIDIPIAVCLFMVAYAAAIAALAGSQHIYRGETGHWPPSRPLHLALGRSGLSIFLVCVNPLFEEMIVRAYAMSEISAVSGNRFLAIVSSLALQLSYHLYQGLTGCVALTAIFTVFAVYYSVVRRIVPIVLAHLIFDIIILFRFSGP